jgi:Spy/CpxP family protein refolding chaperone
MIKAMVGIFLYKIGTLAEIYGSYGQYFKQRGSCAMKNLMSLLIMGSLAFMLNANPAMAKCPHEDCLCDGPGMGHGQGFRRGGPGKMGSGPLFGNIEMLKKKLDLTEKQIDSISKINLAYQKKFLDVKEKVAPLRIQLRKLLLEDKIDLAEVKALLEKMSGHHIEIQLLRIQQRVEIEKELTASQKNRMRAFRHERMGKMGPGGRGGMGGGPGF